MRRLFASSLGLGLLPRRMWGTDNGAGTFGAALGAAMGLAIWVLDLPWWVGLLTAAAVAGASVAVARPYTGDPGWVTIDETAGTLVALVGLTGWPWLVALLVGRLADIFKVLPGVARAERLPRGLGITADDVVAGLYGLGAGWLVHWLLG